MEIFNPNQNSSGLLTNLIDSQINMESQGDLIVKTLMKKKTSIEINTHDLGIGNEFVDTKAKYMSSKKK